MKRFLFFISYILLLACSNPADAQNLQLGADRLEILLPLIENRQVGLVINQTSVLSNGTSLIDTLISRGANIKTIFAPEHGFRGTSDAGEKIIDGKDSKTGIDVVSLYGRNYKPSPEQLRGLDVVVFDIQDVGARFYTYISTMHYVMEACAENGKMCFILDRPNPHDYVDGPVLDMKFKSFVGMHPIPILHGLTVGELANMINGEGWLANGAKCKLRVVPMMGWKHGQSYSLPVKPSPNLPNDQAIKLYASLCFFEATNISVGRGTEYPFQVIGGVSSQYGSFTFIPRSMEGARNPLLKGQKCHGEDLRKHEMTDGFTLKFLIDFYKKTDGDVFFSSPQFMDMLAGTDKLRRQLVKGKSEKEIKVGWEVGLQEYKTIRRKYLLYEE